MQWLTVRRKLEYLAFRSLIAVAYVMPVWMQRAIGWLFAVLLCRVLPRKLTRYDVAFDNIRQAFGDRYSDEEIDGIIFRMWQHLIRLVVEVVQFPRHMKLENIYDIVEFQNKNTVVKALCSGRPVIMLGGHFGNWETSVAAFGEFGFPMGFVARALDNPHLDEWFRRFREHTGHEMIDKKGGGQAMVERLQKGQHLALLGDQDAGRKGVFVDFFSRPASTFKSIALLALQHDAIICVGYAIRLPDSSPKVRYELGCEAVLDTRDFTDVNAIPELTQQYSSAIERAIRKAPEQYFWVHRRWKSQPVSKAERQERRAA